MKTVALFLVLVLLSLTVGMAAADSSRTMIVPPGGGEGTPRRVIKLLPPPDGAPQVAPVALPLRFVPQPDPDCPAKINEGGISAGRHRPQDVWTQINGSGSLARQARAWQRVKRSAG
jgi:hypothetical protein